MQSLKLIGKMYLVCGVGLILAACGTVNMAGTGEATIAAPPGRVTPTETPPATLVPDLALWIAEEVPQGIRQGMVLATGTHQALTAESADLQLAPALIREADEALTVAQWTYVLGAAFPTVEDGVSAAALEAAWKGERSSGFQGRTLLVSPETAAVLRGVWGEESSQKVRVVNEALLLEQVWQEPASWAILPFEQLGPRWKVLKVDGHSPLDDDFVAQEYALTLAFVWQGGAESLAVCEALQCGGAGVLANRDAQKMTSLVMSGTTAMVRVMAFQMEEKGITYPGAKLVEVLAGTDLLHVSNEVPMFTGCPPAVPLREEQRFCSSPQYLALFRYLGVDLIELTGNHILDWGQDAFGETLDLYRDQGLPYYGGGRNQEDARKPYLWEHNGTRLAFVGCNAAGPENVWASASQAGAASCDMEWLADTVEQLRQDGYLPVITFQHYELEDYRPVSKQRVDFQDIAQSGPSIVSGSQAHYPQTMTFVGETFVHYGLGNFLFDQMYEGNRRGFLDRHIFYDGKYINTELLTIILEDGAQPRMMNDTERAALLEKVFAQSVWSPLP